MTGGDVSRPPGEAADEQNQQAVRQLVRLLMRAVTSLELYGAGGTIPHELLLRLRQVFEAVLESLETVDLDLEHDRVLWRGSVVHTTPADEPDLMTRLFRSGLRQLTFTRGLTTLELGTFLHHLQRRSDRPSDDLVERLWEADFEHVTHLAVDGFTELLDDIGREEATPAAEVVGAAGADAGIAGLVAELTGEHPAATSGPAEPRAIRVDETVGGSLRAIINVHQPSFAAERDRWREDLADESEEDLLIRLEDRLFQLIETPSSSLLPADLATLFVRLAGEWVSRGRFGVALEILTRLERARFEVPSAAPIAQIVLSEGLGAETIARVCGPDSPIENADAAAKALGFLRRYARVADTTLFEVAQGPLGNRGRAVMAALLAERMAADPSRWEVPFRRLDADLLALVLGRLSERTDVSQPGLLTPLRWALQRPEPVLRGAAIRAFPGTVEEIRDLLLQSLEAEEMSIRLAAVERIVRSGDSGLAIFLVNRVRHLGEGEEPDLDEWQALVDAVAQLGGERYVPFFRQQLERQGVLRATPMARPTPGAPATRRAQALISALGKIPCQEAVELLRTLRNESRGLLREHCDEVWRRLVSTWRTTNQPESGEFDTPTPRERPQPVDSGTYRVARRPRSRTQKEPASTTGDYSPILSGELPEEVELPEGEEDT